MAHDIFLGILDDTYPLDSTQNLEGLHQSGLGRAREVDLGGVAGDYHLGVDTEAGQEHLHLMFGGVLGLVEDDDGIVESASAHEGERGDLDGIRFHILLQFDGGEHILESVIERAQVWVDLILHVAGEESEFLASLDSRSGEDDAFALTVFQGRHGEGDSDIRLSGSGGAESEREVVLVEGFHHFRLIGVAGSDGATALSEDYDTFGVLCFRWFTLDDVDDDLVGKLIVFCGISLDFLDFSFELGGLGVLSDDLYDTAARSHPQLREEVADEVYIGIVDAIESLWIYAVDYDCSFDHSFFFSGLSGDNLDNPDLAYGPFERDLQEFLSLDGEFHREFVHDLLRIAVDDQADCILHRDTALLTIEELFFIDF